MRLPKHQHNHTDITLHPTVPFKHITQAFPPCVLILTNNLASWLSVFNQIVPNYVSWNYARCHWTD